MEHNERNNSIRIKILQEIEDIEIFTHGVSRETLMKEKVLQKAIVMSLINIGELSKAFSDDYLATMPSIPWKSIRGFRNIAAHQYGIIDFEDVYVTIHDDIPKLKAELERVEKKQ